jgi:rubredoxin
MTMTDNPYQEPRADIGTAPPLGAAAVGDLYKPCPKCGARDPKKAGFTWWGGLLGPKMFKHVNCTSCRHGYNGETGESNTTKIIAYQGVIFAIVIALYVAFGL